MWYLRAPLLNTDTTGHWLMTITYRSAFLLVLYKLWKFVHHFVTGTSELFRVCDAAAAKERGISQSGFVKSIVANDMREPQEMELTHRTGLKSSQLPHHTQQLSAALVYRIDRCLLYSSRLIVERRILESKDGNITEAISAILRKKGFPGNGSPATPQAIIFHACASLIAETYKLMHELNSRAATKYDPTNKVHEKKLLELWDMAMPGEKLKSRQSDQWGKIGFQGVDPATDFRGMGMLGLDDLHYYAKTHPASFHRVLLASRHETAWFSMAIVGINITSFAISLVRTRQLQNYFYTYGATKEVYEEFYCYVFDLFEKTWSSSATPLTVMDFNRVFADFQEKIERQLLEDVPVVLDETSPAFAKNKKTK